MQTVLLAALKYGFLIFCSVYSTIHLTNQRYTMTISRWLIRGGIAALQVGIVLCARYYATSLCVFAMVLSSALIDRIFLRLTVNITLPITIISYGISYALYLCAGLIYIVFELINGSHTINVSPFSFAFVGIIQTIFCVLLFRIKRLHHGLPFLQNLQEYDSGIYLVSCF